MVWRAFRSIIAARVRVQTSQKDRIGLRACVACRDGAASLVGVGRAHRRLGAVFDYEYVVALFEYTPSWRCLAGLSRENLSPSNAYEQASEPAAQEDYGRGRSWTENQAWPNQKRGGVAAGRAPDAELLEVSSDIFWPDAAVHPALRPRAPGLRWFRATAVVMGIARWRVA